MNAIDYVVRSDAGVIEREVLQADRGTTTVFLQSGDQISFNVDQGSVQSYVRSGDDLTITLLDGRVIVLENYFGDFSTAPRVYLSSDGVLFEVFFAEGQDGVLYAEYGRSAEWGKWSPDEALIHYERAEVLPAGYEGEEGEVSMLAAGLLGGLGAGGVGAAGIAAAAGAAVLTGGGGGGDDDDDDEEEGGGDEGGGGGGGPATPTIDDVDVSLGGDNTTKTFDITGTGEPGDTVTVTVGGESVDTVIQGDGTWSATFTGGDFPVDGSYTATAVVGGTAGGVSLSGPAVVLDFETSVDISTSTSGGVTVGGDGYVNSAEQQGSVVVNGTAEAGSSVVLTVAGVDYPAVIAGGDGSWSVTLPSGSLPTGEQDVAVSVVATDAFLNTTTDTGTISVDTLVNTLTMTSTHGGSDSVVNSSETSGGITFSGQVEAGSTLNVTFNGVTIPATVATNGGWTASFTQAQMPTGDLSTHQVTLQATDIAGNTRTETPSVDIDTLVTNQSITTTTYGSNAISGQKQDATVNEDEADAGVVLNGTMEAGSQSVSVAIDGNTYPATINAAAGTWTVTLPSTAFTDNADYTANVTVTTTDGAGNVDSITSTIDVDTVVTNQSITTTTYGSNAVSGQVQDAVVNQVEANAGVVLNGTMEAGSMGVTVGVGGQTYPAVINAAAGTWSVTVPSAAFTANDEYMAPVTVTTTDGAGNVDSISTNISVDTWVNTLTASVTADANNDGVVSASEIATNGLSFSGTVEQGSSVSVSFNGQTYNSSNSNISVAANGAWTLTIPGADVPTSDGGTYSATVTATDVAGNVRSETLSAANGNGIVVDNVAPNAPDVRGVNDIDSGYNAVNLPTDSGQVNVYEVTSGGSVNQVSTGNALNLGGLSLHPFNATVPDGSHLVVTATDAAGNTQGTFAALNDGTAGTNVSLNPTALNQLEVARIDLDQAEDAVLTLSEADVVGLADNTNTVTVVGGADDQVNLSGFTKGNTTTVNGESFVEYTLGDATVLVDSEITNVVY